MVNMPAETENKPKRFCFVRSFAATVTERGFSDASIITGETEVLGHGVYVDEKSIEQADALLKDSTLPSYITHDGAWRDRLGQEIGIFSGFYRDGAKIKAKQFEFLDSALKYDEEECAKLKELAEKMPEKFGLSIVFSGEVVWPLTDGTEQPYSYKKPDNAVRDLPSVRFGVIESCDFVKSPAANPDGLFHKPVDGAQGGMPETILLSKHTEALTAKDAEIAALSKKHEDALAALSKQHADALAAKEAEHKTALTALQAKLTEAEQYDTRKLGVPPTQVTPSGKDAGTTVGEYTFKNDAEKWAKYHELLQGDKDAAAAFAAKYISAKRSRTAPALGR